MQLHPPKNDSSIILRGSHNHTAHHTSPNVWMIGEKDWGSRKAMKAAAAVAVAKWVEQMYAQEVVTTRVELVSGKTSAEGGMPILEY